MDFIKTSSLRALIELTFQRNWNGLIWMSRKGVTTKRVKTGPDGWPRKDVSARPKPSVRLKSRPKFKPSGRRTTRETCPAVGQATTTPRHAARAGKQASRPRNLSHVPRPMLRPSREDVPRPAEKHRPNLHRRPHGRPRIRPATTVPTRPRPRPVRPIVPTDRPNAAVDPKPVLKPDFIFSRPGLTLSRL
ncbi:unnamed protein product [Microthlaspi erraticum]|uniref:Uncharacterized protein n=1 Tax=Microthlaspi erraticum TaxID=1685480 RepID=A0A6D2L7B5_9BRAS|nr:unnamed protein product [Microthlaspi erraticum]